MVPRQPEVREFFWLFGPFYDFQHIYSNQQTSSSGPSLFTLFTSDEAGPRTRLSSGADTRSDFTRKKLSFPRIHTAFWSSFVENHRHSIVNGFDQSILLVMMVKVRC